MAVSAVPHVESKQAASIFQLSVAVRSSSQAKIYARSLRSFRNVRQRRKLTIHMQVPDKHSSQSGPFNRERKQSDGNVSDRENTAPATQPKVATRISSR